MPMNKPRRLDNEIGTCECCVKRDTYLKVLRVGSLVIRLCYECVKDVVVELKREMPL